MVELNNYHQLIDQCHQLILESVQELSDELTIEIAKSFDKEINNAPNNQVYMNAFENSALFNKNKETIKIQLRENISNGFELFKAHELATHIRENDFHNEAWSLIDESILEETICISTLSSEINTENAEKLWQLHQRLTFINKKIPVGESNNPLSPVQFFVALRTSLKTTPLNIDSKLNAYKSLSLIINQRYPSLLNKVNAFFINKNILPEINYESQYSENKSLDKKLKPEGTSHKPIDDSSETSQIDETLDELTENQAKTTDNIQSPLINTIRGLLQRARNIGSNDEIIPISNKATPEPQPDNKENVTQASTNIPTKHTAPVVFDESQIIEAVDSVQNSSATSHFFANTQENTVLNIPTNIAENSALVYEQLNKAAPDGAINAQNMYTIDMVGMLFEYILADENLPDSIKTLLSHLHTPFLKLAFLDSDFFENKEHKSRMLLDSLAEAGANWVNHDGTAQYDMYNEIKHVVHRAIKEFKNDVTLFAELLMEFNLLKKRVGHMHKLRERNSIEKKQGQEKHEQAKALAREEIKSRIEGKRVPSSIISLLSPWFTYLTFIQLKEGTDSNKWRDALGVIDNLIVYCSIKKVKDPKRLGAAFDNIILQIQDGLANTAYNQTKSAVIIDELNELKNSVLNKEAIKTTTTKVSSTPKDTDTREIANQNKTDKPTPEEDRVMNYIKLIEPGTWIEYDKNSRLKVNGFNADARKYILIDQSSQEVMMLTRLELARDILSERATVIDGNAKSLFARALDRIHHNLDKQVKAAEIGH